MFSSIITKNFFLSVKPTQVVLSNKIIIILQPLSWHNY